MAKAPVVYQPSKTEVELQISLVKEAVKMTLAVLGMVVDALYRQSEDVKTWKPLRDEITRILDALK